MPMDIINIHARGGETYFSYRRMRTSMIGFLGRADAVSVWESEVVRERLRRYRKVMNDRAHAKFKIARQAPVDKDIGSMDEETLWILHKKARSEFIRTMSEIDERGEEHVPLGIDPKPNFVDLKKEIAYRMIRKCRFCERRCGADRMTKGSKLGVCGLGRDARVCSVFAHMGEEAPLIGEDVRGSGTIFFASCTFRCVFCQNYDISHDPKAGEVVESDELARIMDIMRRKGVANINLVGGDPVPNTHVILDALAMAKENFPIVWNTNMYGSTEDMELVLDLVDFWLPDFKYGNDECALRLSKIKNYFDVVSRNHGMAYENEGEIVIRHLVMPGHIECCTKPVLKFIAQKIPNVLVNIMDQYHPDNVVLEKPKEYPELTRRVSLSEMREVFSYADELGIEYRDVSK
jgi:putative pyruvate formate lyase activating enzyme